MALETKTQTLGPAEAAYRCRPQIALLTPYNGGNFGDAALQDALIAGIRLRLPDAQFSGVCLNCENFIERHGISAFPICATAIPFYHMLSGATKDQPRFGERSLEQSGDKKEAIGRLKASLKRLPVLGRALIALRNGWREGAHWIAGYQFLRRQDLLVVSGGGQLNEEWGGPWGQPFALFKWAVLSRLAGIPYVVLSVGVGAKASSSTTQFFLAGALRLARYRSYREHHTQAFASNLLKAASSDPVVPDLAIALAANDMPRPAGILRTRARGRTIVALSPIAYAKPGKWPSENRAIYERYLEQMARAVSEFIDSGCFVVFVCSSLWDDESALADILRLLPQAPGRVPDCLEIPPVTSWQDYLATVLDVDFVIASRLHSVILGLVGHKPTAAISFEPKVDWVMEDLGLTEYRLDIKSFTSGDVIHILDQMRNRLHPIKQRILSYQQEAAVKTAAQYDSLAELLLRRLHRPAPDEVL